MVGSSELNSLMDIREKALTALVLVISLASAGCVETQDPLTSTYEPPEETFAAGFEFTLVRKVSLEKGTKTVRAYGIVSEVEEISTSKFGEEGKVADLTCIIDGVHSVFPDMEIIPTSRFWDNLAKEELTLRKLFGSSNVAFLKELDIDFIVGAYHQEFDVFAHGAELFIEGSYSEKIREVAAGAIVSLKNRKILNATQFISQEETVVGHMLFVIPVVFGTVASSEPCVMVGEAAAATISNEAAKPSPRVVVVAVKNNPYNVMTQYGDRRKQVDWFECVRSPAGCEHVDLDLLYTAAHKRGPVEGWRPYCLAAHLGHPKARNTMANYYRSGAEPVRKDLVKAFVWYSLAEKDGISWAGTNRGGIEGEMTPDQIAQAERLVVEWKSNPAECEEIAAQAEN